jgi:hypothetical protein
LIEGLNNKTPDLPYYNTLILPEYANSSSGSIIKQTI